MTSNNRNPSGGDLVVDCGATCEVALFENRTTGHCWYLCPPTSTVLELIEETFDQPDATCGKPGKRHWRFRALQEGKVTLEFHSRRSWEKQPADTYRVTVRVQPR